MSGASGRELAQESAPSPAEMLVSLHLDSGPSLCFLHQPSFWCSHLHSWSFFHQLSLVHFYVENMIPPVPLTKGVLTAFVWSSKRRLCCSFYKMGAAGQQCQFLFEPVKRTLLNVPKMSSFQ